MEYVADVNIIFRESRRTETDRIYIVSDCRTWYLYKILYLPLATILLHHTHYKHVPIYRKRLNQSTSCLRCLRHCLWNMIILYLLHSSLAMYLCNIIINVYV